MSDSKPNETAFDSQSLSSMKKVDEIARRMNEPLRPEEGDFDPEKSSQQLESVSGLKEQLPEEGIALCLSGGGYRAMLYHLGALFRLNELGLLAQLKRVSSVSGGSITAAALALNWNQLQFDSKGVIDKDSLIASVVVPIRRLARQTIDVSAIGWGALNVFKSIGDEVAGYYREYVFGDHTLQDLQDQSGGTKPVPAPHFVFNATNVQTGSLWRFSKPYMADWQVGMTIQPKVPLAVVVAASSAFPPFLSPLTLDLKDFPLTEQYGLGQSSPQNYARKAVLTDGGVYDNLGLETTWKRYKTILVSDGGRKTTPDPDPATDWALHSRRLIDLLDRQVSSLRKAQLISSYQTKVGPTARTGAYWGIQTPYKDYSPDTLSPPGLKCDPSRVAEVANMDTRLAKILEPIQSRLINWGYAVCDVAVRRHYLPDTGLSEPQFPYDGGV